jgi:hypothetical protein
MKYFPFVFTNEKGEMTAFFSSCLTDKEQSWIEVQPVDKYIPNNKMMLHSPT